MHYIDHNRINKVVSLNMEHQRNVFGDKKLGTHDDDDARSPTGVLGVGVCVCVCDVRASAIGMLL